MTDDPRPDDDPATIADAVRALATDIHRALARVAAGEPGPQEVALAELQRRAVDLLDRVGEDRMAGLRRWLESLQLRVFTVEWLRGCLEEQVGIRRPRVDGASA